MSRRGAIAVVAGFSRRRPMVAQVQAVRFADDAAAPIDDAVAEETPVVLVYNGASQAVMMATPADLEDFAVGFSLSEGIVRGPHEIASVACEDVALGIEVRLQVPEGRAARLRDRQRAIEGRTGCGLCGIMSLEQALRPLPVATPATAPVEPAAVVRALAELPGLQLANRASGAAHAAAFAGPDGRLRLVREDVGRHNALDKLIGAMARAGDDPGRGFVVLTSRLSAELVQKAAIAGIGMLVAVSAPTSLAIELGEAAGVTLVAFARGRSFTVYAHPERIRQPT
ncbi:MAG: formate dehydrogenase accessory sulfurtransferase FdhD [Geminicoccaceae bacterium]